MAIMIMSIHSVNLMAQAIPSLLSTTISLPLPHSSGINPLLTPPLLVLSLAMSTTKSNLQVQMPTRMDNGCMQYSAPSTPPSASPPQPPTSTSSIPNTLQSSLTTSIYGVSSPLLTPAKQEIFEPMRARSQLSAL